MPELPEVHTITKDLNSTLKGAEIVDTKITGSYIIEPNNELFRQKTKQAEITGFHRVAKNIILQLNSNDYISTHLGMTGKMLIRKPSHPPDLHLRVLFILYINGKTAHLRFCDTRMFGRMKLLSKEEYQELKHSYGPEPINSNLTPEEFFKTIRSKKTNIKNVLLDQKKISGLGNVYATDALWLAKIHPETNTQAISLEQAKVLLSSARDILQEGIKNRGISMSDYVDAFGNKGKQQEYFRVYQQEKCRICQADIEFITLNGRGTYFCPVCQIKNNQERLI